MFNQNLFYHITHKNIRIIGLIKISNIKLIIELILIFTPFVLSQIKEYRCVRENNQHNVVSRVNYKSS